METERVERGIRKLVWRLIVVLRSLMSTARNDSQHAPRGDPGTSESVGPYVPMAHLW
jgi:hypothetical protein